MAYGLKASSCNPLNYSNLHIFDFIAVETTSSEIGSSPAPVTEDSDSGGLFDWKTWLVGLLGE